MQCAIAAGAVAIAAQVTATTAAEPEGYVPGTCVQVPGDGHEACMVQPASEPVLDEWVGWMVLVGFGAVMTVSTAYVTHVEAKGAKLTSESFNTGGHDVGSGLTAAVIVSKWTWAATLLQSSNMGWRVGVSGPFWYASGATIQILLFAILAIQVKIRTPTMHTYLETIYIRWGVVPHCVFIVFALICNIIVTAMLLLGGAATIEQLTGLNKIWSSFLIPLGVLVYTYVGGLRATFFASYLHTGIIFSVLIIFGFSIYASDQSGVGSAPDVYNSLWASSIEMRDHNNLAFLDAGLVEANGGFTGAIGAGSAPTDGNATTYHCYDRVGGLMENQGLCFGALFSTFLGLGMGMAFPSAA
jgi:Na+/proline symporter